MGSHDCALRGDIQLKDGLDGEAMYQQLLDLVGDNAQKSRDALIENDLISLEGNILSFDIPLWGMGGYSNDCVDRVVEWANGITADPDYIIFHDFDTGDEDASKVPYFIGATEDDRKRAQVQCAVAELEYTLGNLVTREQTAVLADLIEAVVMGEPNLIDETGAFLGKFDEAIANDEEINGGDAVEAIVEFHEAAAPMLAPQSPGAT